MKTSATNPTSFRLQHAARILRQGGVIAYPTEAVFGLGCDPLNRDAVMSLLDIKQRPVSKGLILIASRVEHVLPFIALPADRIPAQIKETWPGPVTWVMPARESTPTWLRGDHQSIAVRVTAHPLAAALCEAFGGALVSTSANGSGQRPARNALQARLRCPGVDLIVHGATGGSDRPTEIRDASSGDVLRAG